MTTAEAPQQTEFDPALSLARQSLYRFAALSLLDPRAGAWRHLNDARRRRLICEAAELIRAEPNANPSELGLGERRLADLDPQCVIDRLPSTPEDFNDAYEQTFGLLVSNACPPYETEYINSKFTFQRSNTLADVSGFYRAFGLQPSDRHPERPDHIVLELEFMATLLGMERKAVQTAGSVEAARVAVCRDAQRRFLQEHLAWWVPTFARLLMHEGRGGFYEAVGLWLAALIPAERGMLKVMFVSPGDRHVVPSPIKRPEACDGCQLVS